jgi:hypothetical protein
MFVLAKSVARFIQRPYVLGSLALIYGYLAAYFEQIPRVNDPALIQYLRRQQLAKLAGKETIWK